MHETFTIGNETISIEVDDEEGFFFAKAICPLCGKDEDSADNKFGPEHAIRVTKAKMRGHFTISHPHVERETGKTDS